MKKQILRSLLSLRMTSILLLSAPLQAQAPIPDHRLFTGADLALLGAFAAGTVALFPFDQRIMTSVRDSARLSSLRAQKGARVFGFLGSYGTFIVGGALYATGRLADEPRLVRLATHGGTAMAASLVATGVLKTTLGRARPSVSADTNPRDFSLFRGWTADAYQAFPSGHSALAFAAAAAAVAEIHGWNRDATWLTAPLLYGGATLVGLSRMYEDRHWPTDILAGAAIGTFAGIKAVRFSRTPTGQRLDRRLIGDDAQLRIGYLVRW